MLIIIATWIVHNWWKLLVGLVLLVIAIEYRKYREKQESNTDTGEE